MRASGSDIIYYPFHTVRGNYLSGSTLDSNGGSWLGKKVIQKTDGTFLFDNIWNDTVIIKTQAHTGDSWAFYTDTTLLHYLATVTSEDTMTVLGSLDSIKTIRINAYNGSGLDPTDSLNNFQVILSKNKGFVKVFDLQTFPYHSPDTTYVKGNDFYFDYISISSWCFPSPTVTYTNSIFKLIQMTNPTYAQLYDWNVGDVFENSTFTYSIPSEGNYPHTYYFDSIINKTISTSGVQYTNTGWKATMHIHPSAFYPGVSFDPSLLRPYDTFSTTGLLTFSNDLLIDTSVMPEEYNQKLLLYYFPNDTTYCINSNRYQSVQAGPYNYGIFCSEASPTIQIYKTGLGLLKYNWNILGGSPPLMHDTTLLYYVKSGIPCGHYTYPSPINYIAGINELNKPSFTLFPNPTTDELTIQTNGTTPHTITLQNMLGQKVTTKQTTKQQETINVGNLPAGVYNVSITDEQGNRHNEKVFIAH